MTRTLVTVALLALLHNVQGSKHIDQEEYDVIVVGAGWAGMAAADTLARGNMSFKVLEASQRTGGRSHAMNFGSKDVKRFVIERGSNWVCGGCLGRSGKCGAGGVSKDLHMLPSENPLWAIARDEKFAVKVIPGSADGNMSDYDAVYTQEGEINGDPQGRIRERANRALDCLNATGSDTPADMNRRQALINCGWEPKTPEEWAVDWAMSGEDSNGERAIDQAVGGGADPTYVWWGPNDKFVIDQNPRGFAHLLDTLVKDTVPLGDSRVVFDAHVTNIEYSCSGVIVTTQDGQTFKAKQVISTIPVGVLQRHYKTLFTPPVPLKYKQALMDDGLMMGNLTHVVIQFPYVWWDDRLAKWLSANKVLNDTHTTGKSNSDAASRPSWRERLDTDGEGVSGEFALWHNLNHHSMIPGSNTLLSFLGDPQSTLYEGMTDTKVTEFLMKRLRSQHPDRTVPEPSDFFISRHGYDPLTYGAYSEYRPGWKDSYMELLQTPLEATSCPGGKSEIRVRFAGEGVCSNMNGFTHGAMYSGKTVAGQLLHAEGKGPEPLDICNF
jgi:polyamine oxidase